ncbi:MAG: hypothetical protein JSW52_02495 [Candidatus Coatesbacteria bacterium]|nr:MAG: hypothetical protein JSW52_02495 [Candidatus Coatesbacteria bacterium]
MTNDIPRGVEVLVKKAAVDPEFKALLMTERSGAAAEIGLELNEAETAMLDGAPETQLESIIANTTVSPKIRPAFAGRVAAVMLAALGVGIAGAGCGDDDDDGGVGPTLGSRPDEPDRLYEETDYPPQASDAETENPAE